MKKRIETGADGKRITVMIPESAAEARQLEADPNVDTDLTFAQKRAKAKR